MKVVWISEYPVEWMESAPESIRALPKQHPATWLRVLSTEFGRRGDLELHVIALRNNIPADVQFSVGGASINVLKIPRMVRAPSLFWSDTWVIARALRRLKPDLVHAWGSERGASLVASRLGFPYVATIQGLLSWYRELIPYSLFDHLSTEVEEVALRRARVLTTECRFAASYLRRRYPDAEVIQAEHAPNWHFHQVQRAPQVKPFRFLFVGTPGHRKGTDLLLLGLNELVGEFDFELTVVGGGPAFVESVGRPLRTELLRRVRVIPGLSPEGVAGELAVAGAMVLPTRADTSPNAVKEAVVAGVPVVASAIGGVLDYVVDGLNGFRFEPGNLDALVKALRALLRHPLHSRGLVDEQYHREMKAYLSPAQMAANFMSAYGAVFKAYGRTPSCRCSE